MSDKLHDPKYYSPKLNAGDVVAVLDELKIPRAHFWGYSMGGGIGFAIARYFPQRFFSFIIGGPNPYKPDPVRLEQFIQMLKNGMAEAVAQAAKSSLMPPEEKALRLANDPKALIAIYESAKVRPGFEDDLPSVTMPCLLYADDADPVYGITKECARNLPDATFVSLPKLNHLQVFRSGDLILPHVKDFLEKVSMMEGVAHARET